MVIVLTGVHQNFCDPRVLFLLIVIADCPAYRRCLDELGPSADYGDNFHLENILKLVMGVVAARAGFTSPENWRETQGAIFSWIFSHSFSKA